MDIQLKQNEIENAVRNYVAEKIGINLTGKRLGIQFSMTRGAQGLVANLSIEDASDIAVPGYTDRDADAPKTAEVHSLTPATTTTAGTATTTTAETPVTSAVTATTTTSAPVEEVKTATAEAVETTAAAEETKPAPAGSIFGD